MPYTKVIPQWNNPGSQPPQSFIDNGFQYNQKPPADYFNWQWNSVYQVLNELHQYALHTEKLGVANGIATLGADSKLTASQLPAIGSSQITDGSITNNDLATDVKVGSLSALTTTTKSNVVAAVNEVRSNLSSHTGDATIHVTPTDKTAWNGKAETTVATTSANGLMSSADKTKLDSVAANANNYVHPSTHPASMITEDTTRRFVTDVEKAAWNAKASTAVATTSANGLMASSDKSKLNGIAANATNVTNPSTNGVIAINGTNTTVYAHPTGDGNLHVPATNVTSNGKFLKAGATAGSLSWQTIMAGDVSGLQALLDEKSDTTHGHAAATSSAAGFMAATDKSKLDGIAAGAQTNQNAFANVKVGATTVAADNPTETLELIAGTNITLTPNATNDSVTITNSTPTATSSVAGLMSASDKGKLDGVAAGANNYIHPSTHPATMITEDSGHRFITDAERTKWDASQLAKLTEVNGDAKSMPNTNADLVIDAGNYNTNSTHTNTPANETNGTLIVVPRGSSETQSHTQFFLSSASGKVYHRIRTSGTWGSWRQFTTNDVTWYNFSFTGGASGFGSGNSYGVKGDGRVYFEAVVTLPNGLSSGTVIATLVAAARPSKTTYIPISTPNGQTLQFFVNTAGQLTLNTATTSAANVTLYGSFALEPNR